MIASNRVTLERSERAESSIWTFIRERSDVLGIHLDQSQHSTSNVRVASVPAVEKHDRQRLILEGAAKRR